MRLGAKRLCSKSTGESLKPNKHARSGEAGNEQNGIQHSPWHSVTVTEHSRIFIFHFSRKNVFTLSASLSLRVAEHSLRGKTKLQSVLIRYIKFRTLNPLASRNTRCHSTCFGARLAPQKAKKKKEKETNNNNKCGWRKLA